MRLPRFEPQSLDLNSNSTQHWHYDQLYYDERIGGVETGSMYVQYVQGI